MPGHTMKRNHKRKSRKSRKARKTRKGGSVMGALKNCTSSISFSTQCTRNTTETCCQERWSQKEAPHHEKASFPSSSLNNIV